MEIGRVGRCRIRGPDITRRVRPGEQDETRKCITFAGAVALAAAGSTLADFTDVSAMSMGEIIPGSRTYRIFANFDDPSDRLLAVSASEAPLRWCGAELVQDAPGLENLQVQDVPLAAAGPGDSWVSIGGNVDAGQSDTAFSPGFLDPAFAGASVIKGSFFEQLENGGCFDFDPGTPENGGSVIIAQFTIAADAVGAFEGTIDWAAEPGSLSSTVFSLVPFLPAPGALLMFGMAGLAGSRRRCA